MTSGSREYRIFLGLSELFKAAVPPRVQESVGCLELALSVAPPHEEARVRRDASLILLQQLGDKAGAKRHLEKAHQVIANCSSDVQCDVIHHLARLYQEEGNSSVAESLLRRGLNALKGFPRSHFRLLFQLAELLSYRGDCAGVATLLASAAQYAAQTGTQHSQILLLLNQAKWLMLSSHYSEAKHVLDTCGQLVLNYSGQNRDRLTALYLVFVVIHLLELGHVKEARVPLKELQNAVKLMANKKHVHTAHSADVVREEMLDWISDEHLFVFVYLVCILHSLLSGSSDKANAYASRALSLIDQNKSGDLLLVKLKASVLENVVVCRLIQGQFSAAIQEVERIIVLCSSCSPVLKSHQSTIHTLLGLYSMTCGSVESTNYQFSMALQTADAGLQIFVWLNQALLSLSTGNHAQFRTILESIAGSSLPESSVSLKTAVCFIRGVHSLLASKQTEAKHYLRDALLLANEHDLNRVVTSVLLLLGQMFLAFGSVMEASDMILPAFQLASKIPDIHLQLWSARQMTGLYRVLNNEPKMLEASSSHDQFMQTLLSEKAMAQQSKQHLLVHWGGGSVENCVIPSSSGQSLRHSPQKRPQSNEYSHFQYPKRVKSDEQLLMQQQGSSLSSHAHLSVSQMLPSVPAPTVAMTQSQTTPLKHYHSVENLLACSSENPTAMQHRSRPLSHYGDSQSTPHPQMGTRSKARVDPHTQTSYLYHPLSHSTAIQSSMTVPQQYQLLAHSSYQHMMQQPLTTPVYSQPAGVQGGGMHVVSHQLQYDYRQGFC